MATNRSTTRPYSSPLRAQQSQRTRDLILDALTALLAEHRADEVTTKQIAERAGVSQPTVYRHFPDRAALVDGLAERVARLAANTDGGPGVETVEDLAVWAESAFRAAEDHPIESVADAALNADPRRFSRPTAANTETITAAVTRSFPDLAPTDRVRVAALVRALVTVQTWFRMREEFGLPGDESGPLVRWAIETLTREIRAGNPPPRPARRRTSRRGTAQ